jgi:glycosyltransferase involved in cell wall biosynthesis
VELTKKLNLLDKVKFLGKKHPTELRAITPKANVGLSIEENGGLSYYYSLPNKISDYIQAGVPVVCSDFPEMKKIIKNHSEQELAEKISLVLKCGKSVYQNELNRAAQDLCWENETPKLLQLYEKVVQENF